MEERKTPTGLLRTRNSLISLVQGLGIKVPTEVLAPPPRVVKTESSISITVKPPLSPRRVRPRPLSPRAISQRITGPRVLSPRASSPRLSSPRNVSPRAMSPRAMSPRNMSPRNLSPRNSPRALSPRTNLRASSPRALRGYRTSLQRQPSPRTRSPLSFRVLTHRPASPRLQRAMTSPRFSLPSNNDTLTKKPLFGKPKLKPPTPTPKAKPVKKVSFAKSTKPAAPTKGEAPLGKNAARKETQSTEPPPPLTPQAMREMEASKAMVSPRIEFDTSRSPSPPTRVVAPEPPKKTKPILRSSKTKEKDSKNAALNAMVTKVEQTSDPSDAGKSKTEIITRKHLYQTFRGLKMARSLPLADPVQLQAKRVVLMKPPGKYRRKTAIFDLDETLVHCLDRTETAVPDVVLPIRFPNGDIVHVRSTQARMKIRPYCTECLTQVSEDMEVIVFTASQRSYADAVMNYIDPSRTLIHHRLYRENCVVTERVHIKDLRILVNRSLKDIVLIDNAAYSFGYQIDNGVPIISWHDDPDDKELLYLTQYLKSLLNVDDVREVNQATFHLSTFYNDYSEEFLNKDKEKDKAKMK